MGAEGCHNSNVPPPFLTKTYEMIDDPATDEIVSWSDNNSSFVVWNVADFTKDLLPQYFKHNNFSSFVRQLNTYGFHKIDPDRQEFANDVFSKGNKEALKHIHRRKPAASHTHSSQSQKELSLIGCNDPLHTELEDTIKTLKQDKDDLLSELLQVRQLQQTTETELDNLAHRFQALEERQQQILAFVARTMNNPSMAEFVQPSGSVAFNKKRRLPEKEAFIGIGESWGEDGGMLIRYHPEGVSGGESSYEQPGDVICNGPLVKSEGVSGAESSYEQVVKQFAALNQSDETSPLSRTSGVTPWEMHGTTSGEHATNVDPAGNGMATQSVMMSPSEAAECSDFACQSTGCGDLKAGSSAHSIESDYELDHEDRKPVHVHAHAKDGTEVSKASGSNDGFWESMLTENPHLTQKDSGNTDRQGYLNERWFF